MECQIFLKFTKGQINIPYNKTHIILRSFLSPPTKMSFIEREKMSFKEGKRQKCLVSLPFLGGVRFHFHSYISKTRLGFYLYGLAFFSFYLRRTIIGHFLELHFVMLSRFVKG